MKRAAWTMIACFAVTLMAGSAALKARPRLIWNASASVPIGLYAVRSVDNLHVNELVAVSPPEGVAAFLAMRGYLPRDVPLLKHVAALPGQTVCRYGVVVTVDHVILGVAQHHDRKGRDLPVWQGCRTLVEGQVFLMNAEIPDSLDGRYFGPFPAVTIIGRAVPMWTGTKQSSRFVKHSAER